MALYFDLRSDPLKSPVLKNSENVYDPAPKSSSLPGSETLGAEQIDANRVYAILSLLWGEKRGKGGEGHVDIKVWITMGDHIPEIPLIIFLKNKLTWMR